MSGRLVVGTLQCLCALSVPDLLARFHQAHPGVEIRLKQGGTPELLAQVRAGDMDVALVSEPPGDAAGVTVTPLASEPMVLACGPGHAFAGRDSLDLAECKDERFVDFHPGWITRDLTDRSLADARIERRVALEVNDVHSLLEFVGAGLGVALVPHSFTEEEDPGAIRPPRSRRSRSGGRSWRCPPGAGRAPPPQPCSPTLPDPDPASWHPRRRDHDHEGNPGQTPRNLHDHEHDHRM